MRVFFVSILIITLTFSYWGEFESLTRLQQLAQSGDPLGVKEVLLLSIGFLLLIESLYLSFPGKSSKDSAEASSDDAPASSTEELDSLKLALSEANKRVEAAEAEVAKKARPEAVTAEVIHLLSLLQEKGRLVDFLMDDVTPYSDEQVGAAARVVHQGCADLLKQYFSIAPIHAGSEGEELQLEKSFNPRQFRLIGTLAGEAPFQGKVVHRGWKAQEVTLPRLSETHSSEDAAIIAPTQVEIA